MTDKGDKRPEASLLARPPIGLLRKPLVARPRAQAGHTSLTRLIEAMGSHVELDKDGLLHAPKQGAVVLPQALAAELSTREALAAQALLSAGEQYARLLRGEAPRAPRHLTRGVKLQSPVTVSGSVPVSVIKELAKEEKHIEQCMQLARRAAIDLETVKQCVSEAQSAWQAAAQAASAAGQLDANWNEWAQEAQEAQIGQNALDVVFACYLRAKHAAEDAQAAYTSAVALGCASAELSQQATQAWEGYEELDELTNGFGTVLIAIQLQGASENAVAHREYEERWQHEREREKREREEAEAKEFLEGLVGPGSVEQCMTVEPSWYGVELVLDEGCTQKFKAWLAKRVGQSLTANLEKALKDAESLLSSKASAGSLGLLGGLLKLCWDVLLTDGSLTKDIIEKVDSGSGVTIHISAVAAAATTILTANPAFAFTDLLASLGAEDLAGGYGGGWLETGALAFASVMWITGN